MEEDSDDQIFGPGTDLAFSLSGLLLLVASVAVLQIWLSLRETEDLAEKLGKARTEIQRLTEANDRLHTALADAGNLAQHQTKYGALRARLGTVVKELRQARANNDRQARENARLVGQIIALQDALEQSRATDGSKDDEMQELRDVINRLSSQSARAESENADLLDKLQRERSKVRDLRRALRAANDQPPLLEINDEENVSIFPTGSAEPSGRLVSWLRRQVKEIERSAAKYGATVVEVVGHTDSVPLGSSLAQKQNLDTALLPLLNGKRPAGTLGACDNVGLGMARAAAVVTELRKLGIDNRLTLLPLSAGPVIAPDGSIVRAPIPAKSEPRRRRIEIRLRRPN